MQPKPYILPIIILSQFARTTLWFAGNAIVDELTFKTGLGVEIIGYVLSSVQLGFITGTLVFALLMVADRFSPSRVFLVCTILAALWGTGLTLVNCIGFAITIVSIQLLAYCADKVNIDTSFRYWHRPVYRPDGFGQEHNLKVCNHNLSSR